jgi:hypothetical protein
MQAIEGTKPSRSGELEATQGLGIDFAQLATRAVEQRATVEDLHRLAGAALAAED